MNIWSFLNNNPGFGCIAGLIVTVICLALVMIFAPDAVIELYQLMSAN